MLIDPRALVTEGMAQNRALAFIAHGASIAKINPMFGEVFGTIYDVSTVAILWFAGASAMSGLLNLVPRYLPRYGMAPRWAEAVRALVIVFTGDQSRRDVGLRRERDGSGRGVCHGRAWC